MRNNLWIHKIKCNLYDEFAFLDKNVLENIVYDFRPATKLNKNMSLYQIKDLIRKEYLVLFNGKSKKNNCFHILNVI